MKILVFILGTLLCQVSNVNGIPFFDNIIGKIKGFADSVATSFREVGEKIRNFVYNDNKIQKNSQSNTPVHSEAIPVENIKIYPEVLDREFTNLEPDPAALLSTPQLAALHGNKVESHVISTKDGYLLTLHRIVVEDSSNSPKGTVLLHHGLLGSSADWILLGANRSLPYILSEGGYDVWMINARGNYYSRGHLDLKVDSPEYWNFSFHEIGIYDLRATLEYMRKVKNSTEQINFIGHSMGASTLLVLLSLHPQYNEYFRLAILLAPLVFMNNVKGPLKMTYALSKEFGDREFFPQRKVPPTVASKFCEDLNIYCTNPLFFLSGMPDYSNWSDSFVSTLLYHVPAGGSTNTIIHYQQMVASGKFHKFGDMFTEYPLSEVTIPIAMLSSSEDWLGTVPDILKLFFTVNMPVDNYVIHGNNISHTEFVWGYKADTLIFPRLLEYLENGSKLNPTARNEV